MLSLLIWGDNVLTSPWLRTSWQATEAGNAHNVNFVEMGEKSRLALQSVLPQAKGSQRQGGKGQLVASLGRE